MWFLFLVVGLAAAVCLFVGIIKKYQDSKKRFYIGRDWEADMDGGRRYYRNPVDPSSGV